MTNTPEPHATPTNEVLTVPLAAASNTPPTEPQSAASTGPVKGAPSKKSPLKTWGMILAIVALVTAVIPGASFVTWLFAIPAVVLGLIALLRLGKPRGQSLFAVIGGAAAWLIAIIVSLVFIVGLAGDAPRSSLSDSSASESAETEELPEATAEELAAIAAEEEADAAAEAAQEAADAEAAAAEEAAEAAADAAAAAAEEAARGTVSQQNAQRSGQNYLDFSAFSRSGLIGQLEYEGFSTEDATWGVDRVNADWNEQAAKSAKNYLSFSAFSRSGLVDQLLYEGFTPEQAEYGVSQTGL